MVGSVKSWVQGLFHDLMGFADYGVTEERYRRLRKNMVVLGVLGSMLPLLLMAMVTIRDLAGQGPGGARVRVAAPHHQELASMHNDVQALLRE